MSPFALFIVGGNNAKSNPILHPADLYGSKSSKMIDPLLGIKDITAYMPFSESKIQEMAKSGDIPMIIFPGSRKYVILQSAFNSWLRRIYSDGINQVDRQKTVCSSSDKQQEVHPENPRHFQFSGDKVVISLQSRQQNTKARHARRDHRTGKQLQFSKQPG